MNNIETSRLLFKPPSLENLNNVFALFSDPDVMRYVGSGVRTRDETIASLNKMIAHYEKHGFAMGDVFLKETGEYVGRGGLIYLELKDDQPDIEIGYTLQKKFWGRGYATEIAVAVIDWAFKNLSVSRLFGVIRPENTASRHVLEKAGMHYIGQFHHYDNEVSKFEIVKEARMPA